jgi:glycosyltransferase involved in cell wall biosynthesis
MLLNPFALIFDVISFIVGARWLVRFLRTGQTDLIVPKGLLAQFSGGFAARWTNIPCVWYIQDRVSERAGGIFPRVLARAARLLAREIIVDAESIARQLTPIIAADHIHVIWNGVDTQEFSPRIDGTNVRAEWNVLPGDILIGSMGRLTPWKGQRLLVWAFAKIASRFPSARLVLVGSALFDTDTYARALKREVAQAGLADRVIFAGFREDTPQVLAALDIFAHTALEKDSSPLAVVSAMASGKPIVCSAVDGTVQLFRDGEDGLVFPPGDADVLAEHLATLLNDPGLRRRLGQAARVKADQELSAEPYARRCESVFQRALRQ